MKVLIVSVHPDDETLGCGGTLLRHIANNDKVFWVIGTSLQSSEAESELIRQKSEEIDTVAKLYNFNEVIKLNYPAAKVDSVAFNKIVSDFSLIFNRIEPSIIYLPFINDIHSDHKIIFNAAYSCTKSFRYPFIKKIYMMETISETEFSINIPSMAFNPNYFVDISLYLERKLEIFKTYKTEKGKHPFPRNEKNIRALATFRGATAGCHYAESFVLLKEIT